MKKDSLDMLEFKRKLSQLDKTPVEMVGDLSEKKIKDLPVEKIDTKQLQQVKGSEALADTFSKIAKRRASRAVGQGRTQSSGIPGDTLDYTKLKQEFKAKEKAERDSRFAKALKKTGKLGAAIGPIGALAGAALAGSVDEALANAVIPGGIEGVGAGSDRPMEDDTAQVKMLSESATDPNLRRAALQELRNRGK